MDIRFRLRGINISIIILGLTVYKFTRYTPTHTYTHLHPPTHMPTHTHTRTHTPTCIITLTYTHLPTHIYLQIYPHTPTHTPTHTVTHTHDEPDGCTRTPTLTGKKRCLSLTGKDGCTLCKRMEQTRDDTQTNSQIHDPAVGLHS